MLELQLCDHETFNRADRGEFMDSIAHSFYRETRSEYGRFPGVYNGVCTWHLSVKKLSRIRSCWLSTITPHGCNYKMYRKKTLPYVIVALETLGDLYMEFHTYTQASMYIIK